MKKFQGRFRFCFILRVRKAEQLVELRGGVDGVDLPAVDFRGGVSQDDDATAEAAAGHAGAEDSWL